MHGSESDVITGDVSSSNQGLLLRIGLRPGYFVGATVKLGSIIAVPFMNEMYCPSA